MRTAVYILLFANLAFLAWAGWIDAPSAAPVKTRDDNLPRLVLVTEQSKAKNPSVATRADTSPRCVSVGPFNTTEQAAGATALLEERGYKPQQREERGETWDGYWVYVGGMQTEFEQARVLRALDQAGLSDAQVMPETEAGRRVSVGLFSERGRAERRARVLRRLGLEPEIGERRVPGSVYWLDLNLSPNDGMVSTAGLLSSEEPDARLEVKVCPAVQSPPASG